MPNRVDDGTAGGSDDVDWGWDRRADEAPPLGFGTVVVTAVGRPGEAVLPVVPASLRLAAAPAEKTATTATPATAPA